MVFPKDRIEGVKTKLQFALLSRSDIFLSWHRD